MKQFTEEGGYNQIIEVCEGKILDITCDCMHSTMEISRKKDWRKRIFCKHIKKMLIEIKNKFAGRN